MIPVSSEDMSSLTVDETGRSEEEHRADGVGDLIMREEDLAQRRSSEGSEESSI